MKIKVAMKVATFVFTVSICRNIGRQIFNNMLAIVRILCYTYIEICKITQSGTFSSAFRDEVSCLRVNIYLQDYSSWSKRRDSKSRRA